MIRNQKTYRLSGAVSVSDLQDLLAGESAMMVAESGIRLLVTWPRDLAAEDLEHVHEQLLDRARLRDIRIIVEK